MTMATASPCPPGRAWGRLALPFEEELLGSLQPPHEVGGEARAVGAVGHAMVERERERGQPPRHDASLAHDGLLPRARDAEDRHLGVVDDRDRAGPAEGPDVGDGEGPAAEVLERGLAVAHALREGGERALERGQRLRVDGPDHGNDQAALGGHGDAEVAVGLHDQLARGGVEARVELGVVPERERRRLEEEAGQREGEAALARRLDVAPNDGVELGDVGAIEVRHVRDERRGQRHALGDRAAEVRERLALDRSPLREVRERGRLEATGASGLAAGRAGAARPAAGAGAAGTPPTAARTSASVTRPPGPEPRTVRRSTASSRASRRVAGVAATGPPARAGAGASTAGAVGAGLGGGVGAPRRAVGVLAASSNVTSTSPTLTVCPGCTWILVTRPRTGDGISTVALSVSTSRSRASSAMTSPSLTRPLTLSASVSPSPRPGRATAR